MMRTQMNLTTAGTVTCEAYRWGSSLDPQLGAAWDALAAAVPDTPPFHYRAWFELAAASGALRPWGVLLMRAEHRPVALFPLAKRSPWSWEVMECFGVHDVQMIVDPQWEALVWPALAGWIQRSPMVQRFSLGETENRLCVDRLAAACRERGLLMTASPCPATVWSDLPKDWESFLRQIGSIASKDIRRAERKMAEECPECTVTYLTTPEACRDVLPVFFEQYRRHWGQKPLGCVFDYPRERECYQRAILWAAEQGFAVLSLLSVRNEPIAVQVMLRIPGQAALYQQFNSRDMEALPKRLSPGIVEFAHTFRWALANGITRINQGPPMMEYKQRFGGSEYPRWQVTIARSAAARRLLPRLDGALYYARRVPLYLQCALRTWMRRKDRTAAFHPYDRTG